jgi:hypothetical protein
MRNTPEHPASNVQLSGVLRQRRDRRRREDLKPRGRTHTGFPVSYRTGQKRFKCMSPMRGTFTPAEIIGVVAGAESDNLIKLQFDLFVLQRYHLLSIQI